MGADAVDDSEALVHLAHGMGRAPSVAFCMQWVLCGWRNEQANEKVIETEISYAIYAPY